MHAMNHKRGACGLPGAQGVIGAPQIALLSQSDLQQPGWQFLCCQCDLLQNSWAQKEPELKLSRRGRCAFLRMQPSHAMCGADIVQLPAVQCTMRGGVCGHGLSPFCALPSDIALQVSEMSKEELLKVLGPGNLPAWIGSPDCMRVSWVNDLLGKSVLSGPRVLWYC